MKPNTRSLVLIPLFSLIQITLCFTPCPSFGLTAKNQRDSLPALHGTDSTSVAELEARIDSLQAVAKYAEAIPFANDAYQIRRDKQRLPSGQEWWETGDSRRLVERLRFLNTLPAQEQTRLQQADREDVEGEEMYSKGQYDEAIILTRRQLEVRRSILGEEHLDTALSLNNLGVYLDGKGGSEELLEAEPLHRKALRIRKQLLGDDHPVVGESLHNLASALSHKGSFDESETLYDAAIDNWTRLFGDEHPRVAYAIDNRAQLLWKLGKYADAEHGLRASLAILEKVYGPDNLYVARLKNNLGAVLYTRGDFEHAESMYRQALSIRRRLLGSLHPDLIATLHNLALLRSHSRGDRIEAESLFREALAIARAIYGNQHADVAMELDGLGMALADKGDYLEGETYISQALAIRREDIGDTNSFVCSLNNLAQVKCMKRQFTEAETLYKEALALCNASSVPVATKALTLNDVGILYKNQGDLEQAGQYLQEGVTAYIQSVGVEHLLVAQVLMNLAGVREAMGRSAEAEQLLRQALDILKTTAGDQHPYVSKALFDLGELRAHAADFQSAEPLFSQALWIAESNRTEVIGDERQRASYAGLLNLNGIAASYSRTLVELGKPIDALTIAERGRSRALLDLLARSDRDLISEANQTLGAEAAARIQKLLEEETRARVAVATAEASVDATARRTDLSDLDRAQSIENQRANVRKLRLQGREAETRLLEQLRILWPDGKPAKTEEIVQSLRPDELFVSYVWDLDFALVFVAKSRKGSPLVETQVLADSKDLVDSLSRDLETFRTWLATPPGAEGRGIPRSITLQNSPERSQDIGNTLLSRLLPGNLLNEVLSARRIILVPDGPLTRIPFDAFVIGQDRVKVSSDSGFKADSTVFWIDVGPEITYAASGAMYLSRKRAREHQLNKQGGPISVLVLADPLFDCSSTTPATPDSGVLITTVAEDGNAAKAGLRAGDVVLTYELVPIHRYADFATALAAVNRAIESGERAPADSVNLTYWRSGETRQVRMPAGRLGVFLSRGSPDEGLRWIGVSERGASELSTDVSALDQIRLHGGRLTRLPGTEVEAQRIQEAVHKGHGACTVLLREKATLKGLMDNLKDVRFLHIATHGVTGSRERPYDASLALTCPAQYTPDDIGFLRLEDVVRDWGGTLDGCQLVVLSACDTDRGVRIGDSQLALPWGFMYAGAPAVIATLWRIDDQSTSDLMGLFYESMFSNMKLDKLVSLRKTVRSFKQRHPHPYYWAPFVYLGDPR